MEKAPERRGQRSRSRGSEDRSRPGKDRPRKAGTAEGLLRHLLREDECARVRAGNAKGPRGIQIGSSQTAFAAKGSAKPRFADGNANADCGQEAQEIQERLARICTIAYRFGS